MTSCSPLRKRLLVIGVGNSYRGDDAVGHVVTRSLRQALPACPHIRVLDESGDATRLLAVWQEADVVLLVDAVQSTAPPGTVHRLDAYQQTLPEVWWHGSTHAFGVAEAIALARVLQQLPSHLVLYGIAGQDFSPGASLSIAVAAAVPVVVERLQQEIAAHQAAAL